MNKASLNDHSLVQVGIKRIFGINKERKMF